MSDENEVLYDVKDRITTVTLPISIRAGDSSTKGVRSGSEKTMRWFGKAALTAVALSCATPASTEDLFANIKSGKPEVVTIDDGKLKGYAANGISTFLGIPFAAPPVGDLRWKPPAPTAKWSGIRDAGAFGPSCVQTNTFGVMAVRATTEDCLYLNVFAPTADRRRLRPVMVWIHGGGLINGRTNDYDPRKLVKDGDVVAVSITYRMNAFGYMAHPALDKEGHPFGNYGTLDQQAALRWVQQNIRAFGGDPNNVTVFGESAGGIAIMFNLVSPSAKGLFHKAILQSGVSGSAQTPLEAAEKIGTDFATAIGCEDQTAACMRSKSVDEIIAKAGRFLNTAVRSIDGSVLPGQMQALMAEGKFHRVPIMMGNNADEWTWFTSLAELDTGKPMTAEDYPKRLTATFGADRAGKIEAQYLLSGSPSPSEAFSLALTSWGFYCPSRRVMRSASKNGATVYAFEFNDRKAPQYFPPVSYPYGATHTLEIQYIFPGYHGAAGVKKPLSADQQRLSDTMVKYWTNFAKTGNPNGKGLPSWPQWTQADEQTQMLDTRITTGKEFAAGRKCDFWDSL
jgi:para-nitrobenzyl esterase